MSEEVDTTISILESYHQNGGTYVIPVEVINDVEGLLAEQENIIKEVRDILKKYICNPSGLKDGWHIDCWNNEDISKLNEDLEILDKENKL